jgi:DNA polymerase-1
METKGAQLDVEYLERLRAELTSDRDRLLDSISAMVGRGFKPSSPKQIQEQLFPKLGISEPSTDVKTLERYVHLPEIQAILEFRAVSKLLGTYIEAFLALPTLPRVHARFNQVAVNDREGTTGIRTGRLSSSDPNLQNIPTRTAAGERIRDAFVARPGHELICADYSQIEYRLLAHFSGEKKLIDAFLAGADVHEETGKALGVDRKLGKTLNFAAIYGAQPKRIGMTAKIPEEQAAAFLERYWNNLPGVRNWISYVKVKAQAQKGVKTMFGKFIPLPGLASSDKFERLHAERAAVNYIIQGSAAEIMKLALLRLTAQGIMPVMTVHDEFVLEVPQKDVERMKQVVVHSMSTVTALTVPLLVEAGSGRTWREAK